MVQSRVRPTMSGTYSLVVKDTNQPTTLVELNASISVAAYLARYSL